RDGFPRRRVCSEIFARRRKFFGAVAMDARYAPVKARRDLARTHAERRKSARRSAQDRQLPATTPRARARRTLLPALPQESAERARSRRNRVHWNVEMRIARSTCWAKHAAQLELLPASTAAFEIRAPNILRPRSERNYLLDDADGNGPIDPSRVLDDWAERE